MRRFDPTPAAGAQPTLDHSGHTLSLAHLEVSAPDALLSLIGLVRRDPRPAKIDLTVGIYRDEQGRTPVMSAVKSAERQLLAEQTSKSYLGPEGDQEFVALIGAVAFGCDLPPTITGLQTPGGTGALRLAADLLATRPGRRIWVGTPTWPNHLPLFSAAGLEIRPFVHYDPIRQAFDADAMLDALDAAEPGDAVLVQACCHNPTGSDPDPVEWQEIAARIAARGLLPLIDLAYQGLGRGLDDDAAAMRAIVAAVPEALIAYSCDKNFGLYRDRTGALFASMPTAERAAIAKGNLMTIARGSYSMPPDHGAAAARIVLSSPRLRADWLAELNGMQARIASIRRALADAGRVGRLDLAPLGTQSGMFSLLPLTPAEIASLRDDHAVYLAGGGRVNMAGLHHDSVERFVAALGAVQAVGVA